MNNVTRDDHWIEDAIAQAHRAVENDEADIAATQITILHDLAGIDPDALEQVTRGRVTCPHEHRELLRDLIQQPRAFAPGPFPWRFQRSGVAVIKAWRPDLARQWAEEPLHPWQHAIGAFATLAQKHARGAGWRFGVVAQCDIDALRNVDALQLFCITLQFPAVGITFAPPTAEAQEVAQKIFDTERGFRRLAESKLRTRSLLHRVMRR